MVPVVLKKENRGFLLTLRVLLRWDNLGDEYSGAVRSSNFGVIMVAYCYAGAI